jgi:hypothetical protein
MPYKWVSEVQISQVELPWYGRVQRVRISAVPYGKGLLDVVEIWEASEPVDIDRFREMALDAFEQTDIAGHWMGEDW